MRMAVEALTTTVTSVSSVVQARSGATPSSPAAIARPLPLPTPLGLRPVRSVVRPVFALPAIATTTRPAVTPDSVCVPTLAASIRDGLGGPSVGHGRIVAGRQVGGAAPRVGE